MSRSTSPGSEPPPRSLAKSVVLNTASRLFAPPRKQQLPWSDLVPFRFGRSPAKHTPPHVAALFAVPDGLSGIEDAVRAWSAGDRPAEVAALESLFTRYDQTLRAGKCPDSNPLAEWKNACDDVFGGLTTLVTNDVLVPSALVLARDAFDLIGASPADVTAAATAVKESRTWADVPEAASAGAKRSRLTRAQQIGPPRHTVVPYTTIVSRFNECVQLKSARPPVSKGAEASGIVISTQVVYSLRPGSHAPVEWSSDLGRAVLVDPTPENELYQRGALAKLSHNSVCAESCLDSPDKGGGGLLSSRLELLHSIDKCLSGTKIVVTSFNHEVIIQKPTGGGVAQCSRAVFYVIAAAFQGSPTGGTPLRRVLDAIDDVSGATCFSACGAQSHTPRSNSKNGFWMWSHVLREVFKTGMVVPHAGNTTARQKAAFAKIISALPGESTAVNVKARNKLDAWSHVLECFGRLAADPSMVVDVVAERAGAVVKGMVVWDVGMAIDHAVDGLGVSVGEMMAPPLDELRQRLSSTPLYPAIFDRVLPIYMADKMVARALWRRLAVAARNSVLAARERGAPQCPMDVADDVITATGVTWTGACWDTMARVLGVTGAGHPLLIAAVWAQNQLGVTDSLGSVTVHLSNGAVTSVHKMYDIHVMPGTRNTALVACGASDGAARAKLAAAGFKKQRTLPASLLLVPPPPCGVVWLTPRSAHVFPAWPEDLDELYTDDPSGTFIHQAIVNGSTACRAFCLPPAPRARPLWASIPAPLARNTEGPPPFRQPPPEDSTSAIEWMGLSATVFHHGMSVIRHFFSPESGTHVVLSAVLVPQVTTEDDGATASWAAVFIVRINENTEKGFLFVRPPAPFSELDGVDFADYIIGAFLDEATVRPQRADAIAIGPSGRGVSVGGCRVCAKVALSCASSDTSGRSLWSAHDISIVAEVLKPSGGRGVVCALEILATRAQAACPGISPGAVHLAVWQLREVLCNLGLTAYSAHTLRVCCSADAQQSRELLSRLSFSTAQQRHQLHLVDDIQAMIVDAETRMQIDGGAATDMISEFMNDCDVRGLTDAYHSEVTTVLTAAVEANGSVAGLRAARGEVLAVDPSYL